MATPTFKGSPPNASAEPEETTGIEASCSGAVGIDLADWLSAEGAHHDVVSWARPFGRDWCAAWHGCPRGDWLLALAARAGVGAPTCVHAAVACARTATDWLPRGEDRPLRALDLVDAWAGGEDNAPKLTAARDEIDRIEPPDPAAAAALAAVLAALDATSDVSAAAGAPASAAQAAAVGVGDCAMFASMRHAELTCADAVRAIVAFDAVLEAASRRAPGFFAGPGSLGGAQRPTASKGDGGFATPPKEVSAANALGGGAPRSWAGVYVRPPKKLV